MNNRVVSRIAMFAALFVLAAVGTIYAQKPAQQNFPWMNKSLSPDERAEMVLKQMTLDEKIGLLHGNGMAHVPNWQMPLTYLSNGGAGYVVGVERLGIPGIYMSDAAYGVRSSAENGRYSTALTSNVGFGGELGPARRMRIWCADWPRVARAGLQHDAGRREQHHARAAQRKNV